MAIGSKQKRQFTAKCCSGYKELSCSLFSSLPLQVLINSSREDWDTINALKHHFLSDPSPIIVHPCHCHTKQKQQKRKHAHHPFYSLHLCSYGTYGKVPMWKRYFIAALRTFGQSFGFDWGNSGCGAFDGRGRADRWALPLIYRHLNLHKYTGCFCTRHWSTVVLHIRVYQYFLLGQCCTDY